MGGPARDLVNGRLRLLGLCLAGVLALWPGRAAAQVVSGTFVGTGTGGRKVTGLGFRPDLVIIKGNDSQGGNEVVVSGVMRTSTMGPGDVSKPVISTCCSPANPASVVVANQITSLDADGFTLGSDRRVAGSPSEPAETRTAVATSRRTSRRFARASSRGGRPAS